jgi:hypothetical protein
MAIVNECLPFDCSVACNGEIDNEFWNNSASSPMLNTTEAPSPTSDADETLSPTTNATLDPVPGNPTKGEEDLDGRTASKYGVWIALGYIVLPMIVMRKWV